MSKEIGSDSHLALFALTGTLVYLFWAQQIWLGFALALFAHGTIGSFFMVATHELGSYCQKLCMGLSCGGAILAFSIHEFDASNDLGELI